jgi:putative transposase
MQLVEKTIIRKAHPYYKEIDAIAFKSKNLYNAALYTVRQEFIKNGSYLSAYDLFKSFKGSGQQDYISLPRKVSMQVLFQVDQNFKAFFAANKSFRQNPAKFSDKPKIPKYKDKIKGRNIVIYDKQAVSIKHLKKGFINPSGTKIFIPTKKITWDNIAQVQIAKRTGYYAIYTVYNVKDVDYVDNGNYAAIDLGLNNLAAVTFSNGKTPIIVNGKPLKSINQYYNKKKSDMQLALNNHTREKSRELKKKRRESSEEIEASVKNKPKTSNRIKKLSAKRANKINDYMHKASRYLVNQLVSNNITNLIIGYNPEWKQEINIGKRNNQNFTAIPFAIFIDMLRYKAKLVGISTAIQEESYTSKCSFLDLESIGKHEEYLGKRIKRGLFKSHSGRLINADVNGSYNIMRKAVPGTFLDYLKNEGVEGVAVRPILVTI